MSMKKWWNETSTKEKVLTCTTIVGGIAVVSLGGKALYNKGYGNGYHQGFGSLARQIYEKDSVVLINDELKKRMTITKTLEDLTTKAQ